MAAPIIRTLLPRVAASKAPPSMLTTPNVYRAFSSTSAALRQPLRPSTIAKQLPRHTFTKRPISNFAAPSDSTVIRRPTQSQGWARMAFAGATFVGGIVAINAFFNRETRDALAEFESDYLRSSFGYAGAGLGIVAMTAVAMHRNGFSYRIMRTNPWLVVGGSLVASIGSMLGVFYTDPQHHGQKLAFWTMFQAAQAATLSPLLFLHPALLSRAALYTAGVMGSLSYVGATARSDKYLYLGGPLLAGVAVVALSSLAPLVLPVGTAALAATEAVSLYGGLAVFGGFVLFDTQKMLHHARLAQQGLMKADPVRESVAFELDFINIFIRLVTILQGQQRRK